MVQVGTLSSLTSHSVTYIFHRLHPLEQFLTNVLKEEAAKGATVELDKLIESIDDGLPC